MDVLKSIEKILGKKQKIDNLGPRLGDVMANYASSKKLNQATGWKEKYTLEQGLAETIAYFKNSPWL